MLAATGSGSHDSSRVMPRSVDNGRSQQLPVQNGNSATCSNFNTHLGHGPGPFSSTVSRNKVWKAEYTKEPPPVSFGVTTPPSLAETNTKVFSFVENDTRCVITSHLFTHLKYMFETAYGLTLKRDLCGTSKNTLLSVYGFPRVNQKLENAIFINSPPVVD